MDMGTQPDALARQEGRAVWFLGTLVIMKATGEQTGGAFGLIDNLMPAGFASPYHMHRNEDESFYVVEGELTFYVGEESVKAEAGGVGVGPAGGGVRRRGGRADLLRRRGERESRGGRVRLRTARGTPRLRGGRNGAGQDTP